jgi:hypothetical protein
MWGVHFVLIYSINVSFEDLNFLSWEKALGTLFFIHSSVDACATFEVDACTTQTVACLAG